MIKTITRADIVDSMVREVDFPRHQANDFLEATLETVLTALSDNGLVKISSFGSFNIRKKASRVGRNPKTGKEAVITPRKVLAFKPSQYLKEKVQKHKA
jgi:integration host factor subunit alpha